MRVLFASHASDLRGGAEQSFLELVAALHLDGRVEVVAVTPYEGQFADALRAEGVEVHCAPTPLWVVIGSNHFSGPLRLGGLGQRGRRVAGMVRRTPAWIRLVRAVAPDVVVTSTAVTVMPAIAAAVLRTPHVWWLQEFVTRDHALEYVIGERASQWLVGVLSSEIVANSRAVASHFSPPVDPRRMHVVHYAIEPRSIASNASAPGRLHLAMLGRLAPQKGSELAIRALGHLRHEPFSVDLRLVGHGNGEYIDHLRSVAKNLGVERMVEFVEFTTRPEQELERANVVLMCSEIEAFGRTTAEALVNGRPVIGSWSGGTVELVDDGVDGFLFPPGDARALADAVRILGKDPERLDAMSRSAIQRNRDRFPVDGQVDAFLEVLTAAAKAGRRA
jgi:glycosyltransferase involved in cell wall biosynthesis